jgi:hypothetical protein
LFGCHRARPKQPRRHRSHATYPETGQVEVFAAGATLLPKEAPAAIAHARPGDTLVFRVFGGHEDLNAFGRQLAQVDGVTIIVVNEQVDPGTLKEYLDKGLIDKAAARKSGTSRNPG